jgi:hypothetical protein
MTQREAVRDTGAYRGRFAYSRRRGLVVSVQSPSGDSSIVLDCQAMTVSRRNSNHAAESRRGIGLIPTVVSPSYYRPVLPERKTMQMPCGHRDDIR